MTIVQIIESSISWLAWAGLGLGVITIISFLFKWGIKFRLTGATIFTLLLAGSCWAFVGSYTPPFRVAGALYAPVVYDNGNDLVIAQAADDFPEESIEPSLKQIAGNLKGGGRKGGDVHVRLRKVQNIKDGLDQPIILGEVVRDLKQNITFRINIEKTKLNDNDSRSNNTNMSLDQNNTYQEIND